MKRLKRILLAVVLLIVLLLVVGLFLPAAYQVERSVVIQAKPEAIYGYLANLKKWAEWCAWTKEKDPTVTSTFAGPETGVGATWTWNGKKLGNGTMTLTAADPKNGIQYDLSFEQGKYKSKGGLTFDTSANSTKVVWIDGGDLGVNPFSRYFGLFMNQMIGPDFDEGLQKLKQKVEQNNPKTP